MGLCYLGTSGMVFPDNAIVFWVACPPNSAATCRGRVLPSLPLEGCPVPSPDVQGREPYHMCAGIGIAIPYPVLECL